MLSLRTGIIGGLMVAVALFWLIPAVLGLFFSVILFAIALPFRLLRLIFITGLGGLLALLWRLFSGFLGLFGIFGALVKWLLVIVAGTFGLMFLWGFVGSWRDSRVKSSEKENKRAWALEVMGLDDTASLEEVKQRYRQLIKTEHPDRLPADATASQRRAAEERVERINRAYVILSA